MASASATCYEYYFVDVEIRGLHIEPHSLIRVWCSSLPEFWSADVYVEPSHPRTLSAAHTMSLITTYQNRLIKLRYTTFNELCAKRGADRAKHLQSIITQRQQQQQQQKRDTQPDRTHGSSADYRHQGGGHESDHRDAKENPWHHRDVRGKVVTEQPAVRKDTVTSPRSRTPLRNDDSWQQVTRQTRRCQPQKTRPAAATVELTEATRFSIGLPSSGVLRIGDSVIFKSMRAIVRWIGSDSKLALQLLDDSSTVAAFSHAKIPDLNFDDVELAYVSVADIDHKSVSNAVYFIVKYKETRFPEFLPGTLIAYTHYDKKSWNLAHLESSLVYDATATSCYSSCLVQLDPKVVFFLFQIRILPRRIDTIQSGQLSLVSAEPSASLIMVLDEEANDPRLIDYMATGTIVGSCDGRVKVQINEKEDLTTVDNVFDIGNPPTWITDGENNLTANNYMLGDFVKVLLKETQSFGFIKAVIQHPHLQLNFAIVEGLKEPSVDDLHPYPRIILPYLRQFVTDTNVTLAVPLECVSRPVCFLLMNDPQVHGEDVEKGSLLVRSFGDGGIAASDGYIEISSGFHFNHTDGISTKILSSAEVLYLINIKKTRNRWLAYQCELVKNISSQTLEGAYLIIDDDVHPADVNYNDAVLSITYRDGFVHFKRNDKSVKTTIDNVFDILNPPRWITEARENVRRSDFTMGEVVAVTDSNPPQLGVVRAAIELPWRKDTYNIALDLLMLQETPPDYTQRIPKAYIPYLPQLVKNPKCCAVLNSKRVHKIQFLLLMEEFESGKTVHDAGSIFIKLSSDLYVDMESNFKVQRSRFPLDRVKILNDDEQGFLYLLKIKDKVSRVLTYQCEKLDLVKQKLPLDVCWMADFHESGDVKGKVTKMEDGLVTILVEKQEFQTTIDRVYDLSCPPSWMRRRTDGKLALYSHVQIKDTTSIGTIEAFYHPPWRREGCYVVKIFVKDNRLPSQVPADCEVMVPYLKDKKMLSNRTVIVSESKLSEKTRQLYFITTSGGTSNIPGTLWKILSRELICANGNEQFSAVLDAGSVDEITLDVYVKLSLITDKEALLKKYQALKGGDNSSLHESMNVGLRNSHDLHLHSEADTGETKPFHQEKMDVDDEEPMTASSQFGDESLSDGREPRQPNMPGFQMIEATQDESNEFNYFISVDDVEGSASLGTLWVKMKDGLVCIDQEDNPSHGELMEIKYEVFEKLKNMDKKERKIQMQYVVMNSAGSLSQASLQAGESHSPPAADPTHSHQLTTPTWISDRGINWKVHDVSFDSAVQVKNSKCFAVIKAILNVPRLQEPYVVLESMVGDFAEYATEGVPRIIRQHLHELEVDESESLILPLSNISRPSFFLAKDAVESEGAEQFPRGSILLQSAEYAHKWTDLDSSFEFTLAQEKKLNNGNSLQITPFAVPFLFRIDDKRIRLETALSGQLETLARAPPVDGVYVVPADAAARNLDYSALGKVTAFKSGFLWVQINGKEEEVTLDKVFDVNNLPSWIAQSEGQLRKSGFTRDTDVEVVGLASRQIGKVKSAIRIPWEEEDSVVLNLLTADEERELGVPRCVVPFLRQLVADPQRAAVVPASRLRALPEDGERFFIQVAGDEQGVLWTRRSGLMKCCDTGEVFPDGGKGRTDLVEVELALFKRMSAISDVKRRFELYSLSKEVVEKQRQAVDPRSSPRDRQETRDERQMEGGDSRSPASPSGSARRPSADAAVSRTNQGISFVKEEISQYPVGMEVKFTVSTTSSEVLKGIIEWTGRMKSVCGSMAVVVLKEGFSHPDAKDGTFCGEKVVDCSPHTAFLLNVEKLMKLQTFKEGDFVARILDPQCRGYVRKVKENTVIVELVKRHATVKDIKDIIAEKGFPFCPKGFGIEIEHLQLKVVDGDDDMRDVTEEIRPISSVFEGNWKGIQGESNSCYLDSLIFSLFAFDDILESSIPPQKTFQNPNHRKWYEMSRRILLEGIVFPLRRKKFVRYEKVAKLRQLLADWSENDAYLSETRDLPECMGHLFDRIFEMDSLVKTRYQKNLQGSHWLETIHCDPSISSPMTSQLLLEYSIMSQEFTLEKIPEILILMLPREKNFRGGIVVPALTLDLKHVLYTCGPRTCGSCNDSEPATHQSQKLFDSRGLSSTFLCKACSDFHKDAIQLKTTHQVTNISSFGRDFKMRLSAVICIEKSHYNCFVCCGNGENRGWVFFDSMSDQVGEGSAAENIPLVKKIDVPHLIRQVLNQKTFEGEGKTEVEKRLFQYPYALVYRSLK